MITSPINPYRYWKLEEIQRMLNKIEGYENVVIEFQYTPSEGMGWHSDHYDCTCGIKEQLVNGQWNWLLKYKFQINDKNELGEARLTAFQEMAERLVTDVWRTSINSFRKEQRNLSKPKAPTTLTEGDLKIIDEINEIKNKTNTNTQTKTTWWTETKLWTVSSIFAITFLTLAWFYPMIALAICLIALGAIALYVFILIGTILLKAALGLDDDDE
jgi:hypothetical protein